MSKALTDEACVVLAQAGDNTGTAELLRRYQTYINKFYGLLRFGRVDLKDKDTRRFLQLYIKDPQLRQGLRNRHQPSNSRHEAYKTASYLQFKCQGIPREDLKQELTVLFIDCVMRYKQTNRLFVSYIKNYYRYRVQWFLRRVFKYDWLNHPHVCSLNDEELAGDGPIEIKDEWFDRFLANALKRDTLDFFWVNGRCSDAFKCLTVFERTILRDRYHLNLTDGDIAHQYGYHINSIWKKRQKAINKLKAYIEREGR